MGRVWLRHGHRARPLNRVVSQRSVSGVQFQAWAPSRNLSSSSRASPPKNSHSSGSGSRSSTPSFGIVKLKPTRHRGNLTASSKNRWPSTRQTSRGCFEPFRVGPLLGALQRAAGGYASRRRQELPASQIGPEASVAALQAHREAMVRAGWRTSSSPGPRRVRRREMVLDRNSRGI